MAKKKLTRKEHIVPRVLLDNFTDTDGWLWVYERGKATRKSRPENECAERDFYEYELPTRRTENRYENWLSLIEGDARGIFSALIERRKLVQQEAIVFASFVASLFVRTRKVRTQISSEIIRRFKAKTESPDFVWDLQYELLRAGELCFADDIRKDITEIRTAMDRSPGFYHVTGLKKNTAMLADEILRKSWNMIEAPTGKFFIISDCPVATAEIVDGRVLPGVGFGKDNAAVFLPLTPKHLFIAGRAQHGRQWKAVAEPIGVDNLNRLSVQFGHRNVYANADFLDIKSFVDLEINTIVFGKNAFLSTTQ